VIPNLKVVQRSLFAQSFDFLCFFLFGFSNLHNATLKLLETKLTIEKKDIVYLKQ